MEGQKKCRYATCSCPALPLEDYCSDRCRNAAAREAATGKPIGECNCGHEDCGGEIEIAAETPALLTA